MHALKTYYRLVKPGIVYGNALTTLAAFLFASRWHLVWPLFPATVFGISFVIGSACVFNNCLDRGIDAKMTRTKTRALVTGEVSVSSALAYATALALLGFALLYFLVNPLTALVALGGFFMYIVAYGWAKRAGSWGTLVGSISGSAPIVAGYTAVIGRLDFTALLLFIILALWQMPHFYAIAMYRGADYAEAGIPTLPAVRGARRTKFSIIAYIVAYAIAVALLPLASSARYAYLVIAVISALAWLSRALKNFRPIDSVPNDIHWARAVFFYSLIALLGLCAALAIGSILP